MTLEHHIHKKLNSIYAPETANLIFDRLQAKIERFRRLHPDFAASVSPGGRLTGADAILITYGDQLVEPDVPALRSLGDFANTYLRGVVNSIHILPFYPYSSDDGFSVIDYKAVNPGLGDWDDLASIRENFRLMFDAVINHISAQSSWFQGFLAGNPHYAGYFISANPSADLSAVTRPRTLPLLTPVDTAAGKKWVWTTFSPDQVDLNYKDPNLLLEIVDVLLFYVAQGAELIRLDAIAFMWKEIGTSCIHLPQTHRVIQLFRLILDAVAPNVLLITETNVPHAENISYFGNGQNEAQMVYQFSLAPLILHTFHTGNASTMQQWAAGLEPLPNTATFFNFIASHDGIGLRPAEGLLTPAEIRHLADKTVQHGGHVGYKTNPDGSQSAYELNITLFDALSDPNCNEPDKLQIDRFIASQAIMLAMVGVPGIYVHSLFGSSNDHVGVEETGRARSINRQKWMRAEVEAVMSNPNARACRIFRQYTALLKARASHPAFHPNGAQQIIPQNPALFTLLRTSPNEQKRVLCIHNISPAPQLCKVNLSQLSMPGNLHDLITGETMGATAGNLQVALSPYQVRWISN